MSTSTIPASMPAAPPPPGKQSNFVNPQTSMKGAIALHTVCLFFVTLCVPIRLYTRQFITRKLGLDDGKKFSLSSLQVPMLIIYSFVCPRICKMIMIMDLSSHQTQHLGVAVDDRVFHNVAYQYVYALKPIQYFYTFSDPKSRRCSRDWAPYLGCSSH